MSIVYSILVLALEAILEGARRRKMSLVQDVDGHLMLVGRVSVDVTVS